ncbi:MULTISPECIES: NAD(P)/FAD-dependent oxidoreductase [unclassified Thioalkalivibrio]|uniref:NAD(P)/FAD-dependent oxidoreductase n=1 Tax=unclassified Thioalkalivibrio TaxID=2621013 RepID=UPI000381F521|nr:MULTISPECIES: FAD-dependent oxidoreductase [unclassified Thioalkalivibrio]
MQRQRIAVIGGGISGLASAWILQQHHDVRLFEQAPQLGGHAHTVDVADPEGPTAIDTGFVVYNQRNYPLLTRLFAELAVETRPTDMSFACSQQPAGIEYAGNNLNTLFAQRTNLLRPRFLRMVADILRFNRLGHELNARQEMPEGTLGEFLARHRLGRGFTEDYLLPMGAAIWSCPPARIREFPAASFLRFFLNHGLLDLRDRPQWRTVVGGSRSYVRRLAQRLVPGSVAHGAVSAVEARASQWRVHGSGEPEEFDRVVFACHAGDARRLLDGGPEATRARLAACQFQENRALLHTDVRLMPRSRRVWSSWNYLSRARATGERGVSVSYWMNALHRLQRRENYIVSLNPLHDPHPSLTLGEFLWEHPVMDAPAERARAALAEHQGEDGLYFAGAWMGDGFHEDGLRSARSVGRALGLEMPWTAGSEPLAAPRADTRQPAGTSVRTVTGQT